MPLIRLARDKRGLDTVYLLHQRTDRNGEPRLRVLYFCTSPQGLAFGRHCLDQLTQRALERRYPEIVFDWGALLKEIDQRRLPPPVEPQARRGRPAAKADRRPPASEGAQEKPDRPGGKRKKRRGSGAGGSTLPVDRPADEARPDSPAPIIES